MIAKDKIAKGRTGLVLDHPFFGSLALRLEVIETRDCSTMSTNSEVLKFNPDFVDTLDADFIKGVLAHEVMHCALGHPVRHKGRDHKLWNYACDYAVNPLILDAGFKLPPGCLNEPRFRDMSVDAIYNVLLEENPPQQNAAGSGQSGDGDGEDGEGNDPGMIGEIEEPKHGDGSSLSESEKKQKEQEWKVAMVQAANAAKGMGQMPGSIERAIGDIVDPKVSWVEILRRFVDAYARNDYQMFPPNRRYVSMGLYLPSARSEELGSIAVAMDTSGSVDEETIKQFGSELQDISYHYRSDITVVYCDHEVERVEEFPVDSEIDLHPKGGGGTDFRPPFEELEERGSNPACMIYFTDGECNRFPEEPAYPVLWAIYGRWSNADSFRPPFGEVIAI